ncbi:baeRF10 domain-containing protein [Candidatus Solirubrobacter pratensis]|uniref:baeRF10 domain-containing protein n=1 Tax=Candidatus Solirubrobacter pratensis TaxID=1298857 RepID=UPI0003F86CC4|nr:Vms1/Ankzf1 family peptidyl-tRNA hydrolase [Candidatus Solirubrobacter pratensis]
MAEPITQTRLRALADVRPERGRVLSVFLNLDPTEFATPPARSSAITSVMTAAAHKIESKEGLSHEERIGLRADVERVGEVLAGSGIAGNGTRGVAVFACGEAGLLEVVRLRRPVDSKVVLDRTAFVEPLVMQGTDEQWMVVLTNRRAARIFVGPGDALAETDRIVDDVHSQHDQGGWSQLNYQRSIEKDVSDHLGRAAEVAFEIYKRRGVDRVLIGAPEELLHEFKGKLHPYLRERIAGKIGVDVENASLDEVRAEAAVAIEAHARKCEREALDRLVEAVGRGGRGAAGISQVLDALNQARVETLLIAENFRAGGRRDFEAGLLLPEEADAGEPVEDIVEPAIEKALEQSASPVVVRYFDDLQPLGGIGAVLRF